MNDPDHPVNLSRRHVLKTGAAAALGIPFLNSVNFSHAAGDESRSNTFTPGQAKAVIEIWMWGGPSHLDTFDPKPGAGPDYCGPYNEVVKTVADGMVINSKLPLMAKQADKFSLIRSMTHGVNAHETASYLMQTGRSPGDGQVYPCIGSVVSKFKGYDAGYKGLLPPYIVLTQPHGRFSEEGFLGPKYKPFATGGDPSRNPFTVQGVIAQGITDARQQSRRDLLHSLDTLGKANTNTRDFKKLDECEEKAYSMILGDARKVFDLSSEPAALRDKYGRNSFGQSCLMARKLVENGVKYITLNYKGWDTHKMHFNLMNQKLPQMDQAIATLFEDLAGRGLLDSTIVWCSGEFGRTPKVLWNEPWKGGRGHFGACFSSLVGGGGFVGGHVVGASDEKGMEVADRPVYPQDFLGSIYEKLGINPEGTLPNGRGEHVPITIPTQGKGRLKEIM
ncbi:MAG: DUF1501 domain-containing protein [Akkermansiaceae bacterium]|nr:DUF1501 domain-containing protein [Akkermansiaceae bacterium]